MLDTCRAVYEKMTPIQPGARGLVHSLDFAVRPLTQGYKFMRNVMKTLPLALLLPLALAAAQPAYAEETKWKAISEEAISLYKKGDYERAVAAIKKSLALAEKTVGPDHPDTATSLNNLAELYREHNRYTEAEPLYKRALTIREKYFGARHALVATTLNGHAELYRSAGRLTDAESLYKRALAIREKSLRPDHPEVGQTLNNLAELYCVQGKYASAKPLYERLETIIPAWQPDSTTWL
jgi:tetratricopeptide (TPR) repeat protein